MPTTTRAQTVCDPGQRHRRFGSEVKVIHHQAVGVDLPAGLAASFAQRVQKALAVLVVLKDRIPAVASIHDVVDGARVLNS